METEMSFLRRLLHYELRSAERYRRFVSLVIVASADGVVRMRHLIGETLRGSDEMADFDSAAAILMPETDNPGALKAVDRYRNRSNGKCDLRFGVVTYPSDSGGAEGLLATAYRRLAQAMSADNGSIVSNG